MNACDFDMMLSVDQPSRAIQYLGLALKKVKKNLVKKNDDPIFRVEIGIIYNKLKPYRTKVSMESIILDSLYYINIPYRYQHKSSKKLDLDLDLK